MTAQFATYAENPKIINKYPYLNFVQTFTINSYEPINDLTCDFIISGHGLHAYNYMKVEFPEHTKYFFIESREGINGDMTRVRGVCDVLYTYHQTILNSPAVIRRTSDTAYVDTFLRDGVVTTRANTELDAALIAENVISDTEYVYVGILQKLPSKGAL